MGEVAKSRRSPQIGDSNANQLETGLTQFIANEIIRYCPDSTSVIITRRVCMLQF